MYLFMLSINFASLLNYHLNVNKFLFGFKSSVVRSLILSPIDLMSIGELLVLLKLKSILNSLLNSGDILIWN